MPPTLSDSAPATIRVAVVEDDAGFSADLRGIIEAAPDLRLAGLVGTKADALALLRGPSADVLLVDLGLPDGSGIDVISAAAREWPHCNIMVSTHFGDESHVMRSIEAGAAGYLLKDGSAARIADEIRSVASGGSPISPIIARQVLLRLQQGESASAPRAPSPLSSREAQVLDLIIKGFTTQEIAKLMALSHFTVRSFVRRIYSKLKVTSKAEAIYEARALGLSRE
jgi:DNA-binding NarL/FixJ family response regulator